MDFILKNILVVLISSIILFLLFLIGYKLNHKKSLKRVLIRTSFLLICLAIAFLITKHVTNFVLYLNLKDIGLAFTINGVEYSSLINLLEGIIVYNKVFVTIYDFFPSLKDLFLEVPQLLVTPFVYVFVYFLSYLFLYPAYLYFSYEYHKKPFNSYKKTKKTSISAGLIGGLQVIFLFSIVLSPLNGYNRAYQQSISATLTEKKSLCEQIETLGEFKNICDTIELYNSTIFAKMSGEKSIDQFIYKELTSTQYGNKKTNIEDEISLIIRSSIVLDQSGIIFYLNGNASKDVIGVLDLSMLGESNINIILDSVSKSKYTNGIIVDIVDFLIDLLNNNLITANAGEHVEPVNVKIAPSEMENEVRIIFETLEFAAENNLLDILNLKVKGVPLSEALSGFDVDALVQMFEKVLDSKIFSAFLPISINLAFENLGVKINLNDTFDFKEEVRLAGEIIKLMVKYKTDDFLQILYNLEATDKTILANILNGITNSKMFVNTLDVLFENIKEEVEITTNMLKNVKSWENEVDILLSAVKILVAHQNGLGIDLNELYTAVKLMKKSDLASPIVRSFARKKIIDVNYNITKAVDWIYFWDR